MGTYLSDISTEPQATAHVCNDCGERLRLTDEVWLFRVVQPYEATKETVFLDVINEHVGDFLFAPAFLCFSCGDNIYHGLKKDLQDEPPVEDPESPYECSCCGSGIRNWEYSGVLELGEPRLSRRSPSGKPSTYFDAANDPELLCLYCLVLINQGQLELWPQLGYRPHEDAPLIECEDCIQSRCWRDFTCDCACHFY